MPLTQSLMPSSTPRPKFNFKRKLFHGLGLLLPIALELDIIARCFPRASVSTLAVEIFLVICFVVSLFVFETIRLCRPKFNASVCSFFKPLLKEEETKRYSGIIPYFMAYYILMRLLPVPLITICCLFLTIADPAASYFGIKYGRHRIFNGKSIEGTIAFIVIAFLVGVFYLGIRNLSHGPGTPFSLMTYQAINYHALLVLSFGVLFASLAELVTSTWFKGLFDDNFTIPVAGGAGLLLSGHFVSNYPWTILINLFRF